MLCLFQVFYELFLENKDLFQYHYQLICPRVLQELNSFSQTNILQQSAQKGLFNKLVLLGACFNTHVDVFVTSINFIIFIIFQQKKLLEKKVSNLLLSLYESFAAWSVLALERWLNVAYPIWPVCSLSWKYTLGEIRGLIQHVIST